MSEQPRPGTAVRDERVLVDEVLNNQRASVRRKVDGLSNAMAHRRLVPSATTVFSVVLHLCLVENWWFQSVLADDDSTRYDFEDWAPADMSLPEALELYESECERSRTSQARVPGLVNAVARAEYQHLNYLWLVTHMIEETARHLGHLDILREQLDGATGL